MADAFVLLPENRTVFETADPLLRGSRARWLSIGMPLTICGRSGSGKTALIKHLIGDVVGKSSSSATASVLYRTGIEWGDEYRRADRDGATGDWLRKQLATNLLIIDGVDTLARHDSVAEQLVAIVDAALASNRRVVLTMSSLPGRQHGFSRRLADRIRGGTLLSIKPLQPTSCEKLLKQFAMQRQMPIEPIALQRLSHVVGTTAGDVVEAVKDLEKLSIRNRSGVTDAVAGSYVRRLNGETPSIPQIARAVAKEFSARVSDLKAAGRSQSVVVPRQTAMFLAREVAGEHYGTIGNYFGNRNHSTVVHSVRRVEQMLDESP